MCSDGRHYCDILCVQVKFQLISIFISGNATSRQHQSLWWVNSWVFGKIKLPSRDGWHSFTLTTKLSHLLLIFVSFAVHLPKSATHKENLQSSCLFHSLDSFYISSKIWVVWGDCTGEGERTNWASLGAHHTWGLPSPGLRTLICHCKSFPKCGRREKWGPLPLCEDWIRQNDEESVLTQHQDLCGS